jgi:glycosyltransferase involved in cell wall biosynthesis
MKVLVATDAWPPQVNGVVRTLKSLERAAAKLGVTIDFLSPDGFPSFPVPTYPGLRLALPSRRRIAGTHRGCCARCHPYRDRGPDRLCSTRLLPKARPALYDELHDAISGIYRGAFTDSGKLGLRCSALVSFRRKRDDGGDAFADQRTGRARLSRISDDGRGAWTSICFARIGSRISIFPRPIFMTLGRVAVEKNIDAFLALDLPGTKVVIGKGPQEEELKRRFPDAKFLGHMDNGVLASHLAAADVFVFPSLTDTFGIVQLEALASGVPVAAYPVTGPKDVIADNPIGALNEDLRTACLEALKASRETCRAICTQILLGK